ncbi:hypothetical protein BGZ73_007029 [Actinomortierella ambigua]|nr:hypothetical protein BGZ73_007029 [Actinomortierella ambigua]
MDHGRDLGSALKKLVRTDQKNEHALTDWDTALRLPFERLYAYDSWLQRIDPASTFAKEPRAHIAGLSHRIRTVTDASPNSKGVLRRLSTIARGVMKRKSTATFGGLDQLPEEPVTPATSMTVASTGAFDSTSIGSTASIQSNFTHTRTLSSTTGSKGLSNSSEDTIETVMDTTVDEVAELAVKPRRGIFPRRSLDSARPLSGWFADTRSSKHKEQGQPDQEQAAAPVAAIKHEPLPKRYSLFIEPDVNDTFSVQSFVKELKLDSYLFNNVIAESPTHTGASTPSPPSPRPASSRFSTKSVRNDNDSIMTNHSTHQNTEMTTVSYDINFSKDEDTAMTNAEDDGDAALTTPATTTGITKPNPQTQQPAATTISTSTPMPTPISTHQRKRTTSQNLSPRQRQGRHQESINGIVASASKNLEALAPVQQGATLSTASSFESLQTKRSTTSLTSTSSATTLASSKDVSKMETARLPPLPRPSTPMSIALPTQQPYKPKSFTAAAAASQLPPLRPKTHLTIATPSMPLSPLMASPRSTASSLATTPTSPSYPVVSKDLMALRRANMMAKAECLHLPRDIVPKSGVDQLRITNAKQKAEKKPPVRSLISFWEQVSDPADADC